MKKCPKILIIAGSDSSGGAGIQADVKTATSLGVYAMTAITAITAQNTTGVKKIIPIKPKDISEQIEYTLKDIKPDVIKIGMLHNETVAKNVIKSLKKYKQRKIIFDPVMVSTSGAKLVSRKCIKFIKKKLIKEVLLITPNIPEAEILSGIKIHNVDDMILASKKIMYLGAKNILIKGGHLKLKEVNDILFFKKKISNFKNRKIKSKNTHGTGCTLSTAIASLYSCGKTLKNSCYLAIKYVNNAIKTAPNIGKGNGPINHLFNIKK